MGHLHMLHEVRDEAVAVISGTFFFSGMGFVLTGRNPNQQLGNRILAESCIDVLFPSVRVRCRAKGTPGVPELVSERGLLACTSTRDFFRFFVQPARAPLSERIGCPLRSR